MYSAVPNIIMTMLEMVSNGDSAQVNWLTPEKNLLEKACSEDSDRVSAFPTLQAEVVVGGCTLLISHPFCMDVHLNVNREAKGAEIKPLENARWKSIHTGDDSMLEALIETIVETQPALFTPCYNDLDKTSLDSELGRFLASA